MGGSGRGGNRNICRDVPGSVLDGVKRKVVTMARVSDMDFREWYERIRGWAKNYRDIGERTAVIAGAFGGMPSEMRLSPAQIKQVLDLRYPEEME